MGLGSKGHAVRALVAAVIGCIGLLPLVAWSGPTGLMRAHGFGISEAQQYALLAFDRRSPRRAATPRYVQLLETISATSSSPVAPELSWITSARAEPSISHDRLSAELVQDVIAEGVSVRHVNYTHELIVMAVSRSTGTTVQLPFRPPHGSVLR